MSAELLSTVGAVGAACVVVVVVSAAVLGICAPFMLLSAARSLRRIANELERANDYREHYAHGKRPTAIGA
jgi:hypothetical protein